MIYDTLSRIRKKFADALFSRSYPEEIYTALEDILTTADADSGTEKLGLFRFFCDNDKTKGKEACEKFFIALRTVYLWREDIISTAMVLCAEKGLFSLKDSLKEATEKWN